MVALLAEGVDRNYAERLRRFWTLVALLAEGVDRNMFLLLVFEHVIKSPSSRRAWIEIFLSRRL